MPKLMGKKIITLLRSKNISSSGPMEIMKHLGKGRECLQTQYFPVHPHQQMSRDMRFPTMWYVPPAKAQTSLRIHAVSSEPLQVA